VTPSKQLAILPKQAGRRRGDQNATPTRPSKPVGSRRGGAARAVREECERFFCESMRAAFHGDRNAVTRGSGWTGVDMMHTPPPEGDDVGGRAHAASSPELGFGSGAPFEAVAWLEVWDWVGGVSFRAFLAADQNDDSEKSLFAFFDRHAVLGRDLKSA